MNNEIALSVICITYNQSKYIRDAIDSMLSQITTFSYEIIIHDDASTDGTREIIKEYYDNNREKIVAIIEDENQYSQNIDFITNLYKNVARGKYIALCEGDDFWLDEKKLQIQFEAMETHPECDMCACWGCTVTEDGKNEISQIRPQKRNGFLNTEEVILGGGQYLVTAGLFFRKNLYDVKMDFEKVMSLDYVQQIRGSLRGGIYYIDRKMAAYRRNASGSWSLRVLKQKDNLKKQWEKEKEMLNVLDKETDGKYHDTISLRLKSYTTFVEQLSQHKDEIIDALSSLKGSRYVWGMGRRGEEFEEFCYNEGIHIDGFCDLANEHVGETTIYGNKVFDSNDVQNLADNILASNEFAYNDIKKSEFKGNVVNLQRFMPYG